MRKRKALCDPNPTVPTVIISVRGGVAFCTSKPAGIEVVIDDEDACAEEGANPFTHVADCGCCTDK